MKTDAPLKPDVSRALDWDTPINAAHVGVASEPGMELAMHRKRSESQVVSGTAWSAPGLTRVVNEFHVGPPA